MPFTGNIQLIIGVATGVILFLYGIESFSREVQTIAGADLRKVLGRWTRNRGLGVLVGAGITALIQSSTATSVLTASLVNSAVISFRQSLGIILGTNIGTTVTAFMVAFKLTNIGPWFIILGFLLSVVRIKYSFFGKAIFYFGLVLLALASISAAAGSVSEDAYLVQFVQARYTVPKGILFGCIVTLLIQSSSVTTGLAVLLVQSGIISFSDAIPIILGANVGTTATGLFASLTMDVFAKRTAVANTIFNIGGVMVFLPLLGPFTHLIDGSGGSPAEKTALAHLTFNLATTGVFLVLFKPLALATEKLIPTDEKELEFKGPLLAGLQNTEPAEVMRTLERDLAQALHHSKALLATVVSAIDLRSGKIIRKARKQKASVDFLASNCEELLREISRKDIQHDQAKRLVRLLRIADYERQIASSIHQLSELPELPRLPAIEELTVLKAAVFQLTALISQAMEHLADYILGADEIAVARFSEEIEKASDFIDTEYQKIIYDNAFPKGVMHSFYLAFLTKMQSTVAKMQETRKLAVNYHHNSK